MNDTAAAGGDGNQNSSISDPNGRESSGARIRMRVERTSSVMGPERGFITAQILGGPEWTSGKVLAQLTVEGADGAAANLAMELIESAIAAVDAADADAGDGDGQGDEPEPLNSRRAGSVRLLTADGHRVCDLSALLVAGMAANGSPPEVIVWGARVFTLAPNASGRTTYVEGLAYVVAPSDTVTL